MWTIIVLLSGSFYYEITLRVHTFLTNQPQRNTPFSKTPTFRIRGKRIFDRTADDSVDVKNSVPTKLPSGSDLQPRCGDHVAINSPGTPRFFMDNIKAALCRGGPLQWPIVEVLSWGYCGSPPWLNGGVVESWGLGSRGWKRVYRMGEGVPPNHSFATEAADLEGGGTFCCTNINFVLLTRMGEWFWLFGIFATENWVRNW